MTVKSHIDANDMNGNLGQQLKENLESQGFRKVRVLSNRDDESLSVEGRIGDRGKVTIRVNGKDERQEIILVDVYRQSKLIWSRIDLNDDFPDIISFVKSLNSPPLKSGSLPETTPELLVEDAAKPIPASTPESFFPTLTETVTPELVSLPESNEAQKPKPTKFARLGNKATLVLPLLATTMTIGTFLYLVWEVRSSNQQIQQLKEQLQNQR